MEPVSSLTLIILGSSAVGHMVTAFIHWNSQRNLVRSHQDEMSRLQNQTRDQIARMELEMQQVKDGLQLLFATAARVPSINTTTRSIPPQL